MYLIPSLERRVTSLLPHYLSQYFNHSCCLSWTKIMQKSYFLLMTSTRSVAHCRPPYSPDQHSACLEAIYLSAFTLISPFLFLWFFDWLTLNTCTASVQHVEYFAVVFFFSGDRFWFICYFSTGVCFSFDKECPTAAPGDGRIHILLSCWLQPGTTFWLQASNGKWTIPRFFYVDFKVLDKFQEAKPPQTPAFNCHRLKKKKKRWIHFLVYMF